MTAVSRGSGTDVVASSGPETGQMPLFKAVKAVGITVKPHAERAEQALKRLLPWLEARSMGICLDAGCARVLGRSDGLALEEIAERSDLIIVLGGDGTLLAAARHAAVRGVPVLGINLGSLGFLTEVPLEEMEETLEAFERGECRVSTRMMLEARVGDTGYVVLNDAVVHKSTLARIVEFDVRVDGRFMSRFLADGLICSTPTGSTAYSLAAGGPILSPDIAALLLTPVCPHTLTHRPLVLPGESRIEVRLMTPRDDVFLTLDGQRGHPLATGQTFTITRATCSLSLVQSVHKSHYDILRGKLKWGQR